jgi:hypothetical protein
MRNRALLKNYDNFATTAIPLEVSLSQENRSFMVVDMWTPAG